MGANRFEKFSYLILIHSCYDIKYSFLIERENPMKHFSKSEKAYMSSFFFMLLKTLKLKNNLWSLTWEDFNFIIRCNVNYLPGFYAIGRLAFQLFELRTIQW